jgi:hypothetical protein
MQTIQYKGCTLDGIELAHYTVKRLHTLYSTVHAQSTVHYSMQLTHYLYSI